MKMQAVISYFRFSWRRSLHLLFCIMTPYTSLVVNVSKEHAASVFIVVDCDISWPVASVMTRCVFIGGPNASEDHSAPVFREEYCNLESDFSVTTEFSLVAGYQHFGRSCLFPLPQYKIVIVVLWFITPWFLMSEFQRFGVTCYICLRDRQ